MVCAEYNKLFLLFGRNNKHEPMRLLLFINFLSEIGSRKANYFVHTYCDISIDTWAYLIIQWFWIIFELLNILKVNNFL